jgi:uncharacterized membrane protein
LDGLTRSSRAGNGRARASLLLGLVAVAALPATIAAAEVWDLIRLIEASAAIPVAFVFGVGAILLARGARKRVRRTIGRVGGERLAAVGRLLGALGVALALSGAIAVGFYLILQRVAE